MASDFPAYVISGAEKGSDVNEYTPASDAHVVPGDFWFYDTTGNDANICGTDPAIIAGISETDSDAHDALTPNAKVPLRIIRNSMLQIALASATTPADTHIGDEYGITVAASGNWLLDTAKTGASARVLVSRVNITEGIFYVSVLNDQLQFAATA